MIAWMVRILFLFVISVCTDVVVLLVLVTFLECIVLFILRRGRRINKRQGSTRGKWEYTSMYQHKLNRCEQMMQIVEVNLCLRVYEQLLVHKLGVHDREHVLRLSSR